MRTAVLALLATASLTAQNNSPAYSYLEELTTTIGPRLTGSTQAAQASQWALDKMETIGLKNVHAENWPLGRGWERGSAEAEQVKPFHLSLNIVAYGWSGSANAVDAEVMPVNSDRLIEEIRENSQKWTGKILLLSPANPSRPMRASALLAQFAGAAMAKVRSQ